MTIIEYCVSFLTEHQIGTGNIDNIKNLRIEFIDKWLTHHKLPVNLIESVKIDLTKRKFIESELEEFCNNKKWNLEKNTITVSDRYDAILKFSELEELAKINSISHIEYDHDFGEFIIILNERKN